MNPALVLAAVLQLSCVIDGPPPAAPDVIARDAATGLRQNDHIGVMFDTFYDRRSGFLFYSNPIGARADSSVVDEDGLNTDWNPVWESKTGRFDGGWTIEMAIPFKSLRYRSGPNQVYRSGSELFVVCTDERDTAGRWPRRRRSSRVSETAPSS